MDGLVIIDKPSGKTSHDIVAEIKRTLKADKVGHTGTLDPLATGVLPVLINRGTKLAPFLVTDSKEYQATLLLGIHTDTLDITGNVLSKRMPDVSEGDLVRVIDALVGEKLQVPPLYSAVKFKGKPLYRWARRGITVTPPPRTVEVYAAVIRAINMPRVTIHVACSKGTYIRSLCSDIGETLGCGAALEALRRTRSGFFKEETALALEGLTDGQKKDRLLTSLIPLEQAIPGLKSLRVDEPLARRVRQGVQLTGGDLGADHIPFLAPGDVLKLLSAETGLVAVAEMLCGTEEMRSRDKSSPVARMLRVFK